MHNLRAMGLLFILALSAVAAFVAATPAQTPQQVVETVDIQGNRRLRDEDLMYYIKTRPGDVYDPAALERDLKELLSLNFFDKTATRVLTQQGARGGVDVIFEVKELPIIRDMTFSGLKAVQESDVLKAFREQRVGISKEAIYDPVKSRQAIRVLRELLASKGFPNAKVDITEEEISATSIGLNFTVDQGPRSRIIEIDFTGNEHFKQGELRNALTLVKETGLISRIKGQDILDIRKLEYDLDRNVLAYIRSKGYLQARIGEPQVVGLGVKRTDFIPLITLPLPLISSKDDTLKIVVPITEGKIYRVGELKVEGNSIFSEQQILAFIGLRKGEVVDGKRLRDAIYEDLRKAYGSQGFVQYQAEPVPEFKDNPANANEGIADITISITEGKQFTLRRLEFTGNTFTRDRVMRREFLLNEGDIYNENYKDISIARLNQTQYFDPIDKDQDVETHVDDEQGDVDLVVKVKEKGRQQISFNGGVGGIGGSFFGFEYSTNNLMGKGEILSIAAGWGNRQQNLQFSFQEPYFKNRPISVGFSLFASKYQFFGEGTLLSQNTDLISQILDPVGQLTANSENLFTQATYGGTLFATAPLSELFFKKRRFTQFSRVGLTYQLSATSIQDPKVNQENNPNTLIPVVYAQPNIITSRVTASFVYDTRQPAANGIDTNSGRQLSVSLGFAGLLGDVRTYSPSVSYTQFIPVRHRKSKTPEVFAFRLMAGTIGSWSISDAIRNANSIAFVGGIPVYERYYLGSENDVRGYTSRSIGPIAPFDSYVTTRNVSVATNASGTPVAPTGLNTRDLTEIGALGQLTGSGGSNPALLSSSFRFIGGDTQLLGNFEYRFPLFGPATLAAFADIGSVFNLHKTGTQFINSEFLPDDSFLGAGTMTALALKNAPQLENSFGSILYYNNRVMTKADFLNEFCTQRTRLGCPLSLPNVIQSLFVRGEAQQNSLLRVNDAVFADIGDYRSSIGLELRVQVPIVNVPFRLIYYYNPNAVIGNTEQLPGIFLPGKHSGFKFTVGRTF